MIDIEKAKKEFISHVEQIGINNSKIQTKIGHTFRVIEICKKIATKLDLSEEEIQLAGLIGLLHDIGRFEQYKIYDKNTNSIILDNSIEFNHGEVGVQILKNNDYIRKYIEENKYDKIILTAIYEHNRYEISKELTKEEKLFSKIIRDADKIDIIYEAIYFYWQEEERIKQVEFGKLSPKMLEDFYSGKLADNKNRISQTDQILRFSSFVYDINFKCSFEMLKESDNISKMIVRFDYKIPETKQEMIKVKKIVNQYIEERIK